MGFYTPWVAVRCSTSAGRDFQRKTVVAGRLITAANGRPTREARTFGTMTHDLLQLHAWLVGAGCTHVAMERTGDDGRPVSTVLAGRVDLLLVHAGHSTHVPGRKTDVNDAEWIAELLRHGSPFASDSHGSVFFQQGFPSMP